MKEYLIVGFSKSKSKYAFLGSLIRWIEKTPYSHVFIALKCKSINRIAIYHASKTMLHFVSLDRFSTHNAIVFLYTIEITPEQKKKIMQYCVDTSEMPYGIMNLIGVGVVKLAKFFGKDIKNPFSDGTTTMICNELAGNVLKILGFDIDEGKLEATGPRYLHDFMEKNSQFRRMC